MIEWLKFKVPEQLRETFIQKEAEIWTPVVANSPGFVSKEIWINPSETTELIITIRWSDRHLQAGIPSDVVERTEAEFYRQMDGNYQLVESGEYQVRKVARSPNRD